jgi:hypothetical protein
MKVGNPMASMKELETRQLRLERILAGSVDGQMAARTEVAEIVHGLLDTMHINNPERIPRLWAPEHDRVGPLGGLSSQINLYIEGVDGKLAPVTINVYSDKRIQSYLVEKLEAEKAEAKFEKQVRKLVRG